MIMAEPEKFNKLTHMKYADQAKWYLNGFWKEGAEGTHWRHLEMNDVTNQPYS